jgi:hypothetical protein
MDKPARREVLKPLLAISVVTFFIVTAFSLVQVRAKSGSEQTAEGGEGSYAQQFGENRKELSKRHKEEWKELKAKHKAEEKELTDRHKAENRELKEKNKAEKEDKGKKEENVEEKVKMATAMTGDIRTKRGRNNLC